MAMNWASKASAIRRASVVLPMPGGPHRIIECRRPDSKATRSGLPGPSRCCWPIDLVERLRSQPFGKRGGGGVGEAEFERGLGQRSDPLAQAFRFCRVAGVAAGRDIR